MAETRRTTTTRDIPPGGNIPSGGVPYNPRPSQRSGGTSSGSVFMVFLVLGLIIAGIVWFARWTEQVSHCSLYTSENGAVAAKIDNNNSDHTVGVSENNFVIRRGGSTVYIPVLNASISKKVPCNNTGGE